MTTIYVTHPRYTEHHLPGHAEHEGRIRAIWRRLDDSGLSARMKQVQPEPATDNMILSVHTPEYLDLLRRVTEQYYDRTVRLDADTYFNPTSLEISYLAAGGAVRAVDALFSGEADNALAVVRPPGHHAMPDRAMGFCVFGNIAIAARYAQQRYNVKRVMLLDYDVHHGNGTEAMFYDDPSVLFISTHQYGYPFYPGTGAVENIGGGEGKGYTVNIPLAPGHGDQSYAALFEQVVAPVAARYQPELILVSAGFDAHWTDPLAGIRLSVSGYAHLSRELVGMAEEYCGGKIAFILEGGYNVDALSLGVSAVVRTLLGDPEIEDPLGPPRDPREPDVLPLIATLKKLHRLG